MTEEQKEILITCCKCHGQGSYLVPSYENFDINKDEWEKRECELCHGTGKISLAFYEDLQRCVRKR
jgi:DnaJ-class molecular chaperone